MSADNGFFDSTSVLLSSEKSVEELIQQPPLQGIDDNLVEFSEALRSEYLDYSLGEIQMCWSISLSD